jgi:hypothetical protein
MIERIDLETGEVTEYPTIQDACQDNGLGIMHLTKILDGPQVSDGIPGHSERWGWQRAET